MIRKNLANALGFIAVLSVLFAALNWGMARMNLVLYGEWSGNLQLELKLEKYREFALQGPVDYVILGSSVADCGVSAESLSNAMGLVGGRPVRIFNFALSAGSGSSFLLAYRLLRDIAVPRRVIVISHIEEKNANDQAPGHLDAQFAKAPIGRVSNSEAGLKISQTLWSLPAVRHGLALSDYLITGDFYHRTLLYSVDYHPVSAVGDSPYRHFSDGAASYGDESAQSERIAKFLSSYPSLNVPLDERMVHNFVEQDRRGFKGLKELLNKDGVFVDVAVIESPAVMAAPISDEVIQGRNRFHATLAEFLGAPVYNVMNQGFRSFPFEKLDFLHMNFAGAERYSRWLASALLGRSMPNEIWVFPNTEKLLHDGNPTFNFWSDIIVKRSSQSGSKLRVQFVNNRFTKKLLPVAGHELYLALRTYSNQDLVVVARRLADDVIEADVSAEAVSKNQAFVLRVLMGAGPAKTALNLPLQSYQWL